jgi:hypothetical protein
MLDNRLQILGMFLLVGPGPAKRIHHLRQDRPQLPEGGALPVVFEIPGEILIADRFEESGQIAIRLFHVVEQGGRLETATAARMKAGRRFAPAKTSRPPLPGSGSGPRRGRRKPPGSV